VGIGVGSFGPHGAAQRHKFFHRKSSSHFSLNSYDCDGTPGPSPETAMPIPPLPRRARSGESSRSLRKEDTKRKLVDAAEDLIRERGYDDTTVTEIARRAGVVPSLINTYFNGKAGLLYAIIQRHNEPQFEATKHAAAAPGTPRERLLRVITVWAEGDLARGRLLGPLMALTWYWPAETEAQNIRDRLAFFVFVEEVLRDGAASGQFRSLPPAQAVEAIFALYTWSLRPGVFNGAPVQDCVALAMSRIDLLLAP
jgi:AcrR family transcriptional regulator